jgi:hypothetical protein
MLGFVELQFVTIVSVQPVGPICKASQATEGNGCIKLRSFYRKLPIMCQIAELLAT